MHFIKTFKCMGTKSHTVFSLKLFYLLCFCGYVPRSLLMSLCVLAPLNKLLPFKDDFLACSAEQKVYPREQVGGSLWSMVDP